MDTLGGLGPRRFEDLGVKGVAHLANLGESIGVASRSTVRIWKIQ